MRKLPLLTVAIALLFAFSAAGLSLDVSARPLGATSPTLGASISYSILAGETVTNTGPTTISGDLGVSPGSAVTGFPPGIVSPSGAIHKADASAAAAQLDNVIIFGTLDQACDVTYPGTKDLVGENLVPGVYCADAFALSGSLTLSGSGVWIFKSASTLITSGSASVSGGDPCNVWWRAVSSATLGTGTSLIGSILASTSISFQTGAKLSGRAFVQTGSITLDNASVDSASCFAPALPTATATLSGPVATNTATATLAPVATNTVAAATLIPVATRTVTRAIAPTAVQTATLLAAPLFTSTAILTIVPSTTPTPTSTLLPLIIKLPNTGGAPIQNEDSPMSFLVVIALSAIFLVIGAGVYRRTHLPKQ